MDLDEVADALYGLPRDEFTRARDERAKRARADGERELASAIGRLRRPTMSAWLVNQLARQRPERLAELAGLGEAMRAAHARLDGAELRRLSGRRRELVAALAGLTRELGERAGASVSEAVGRELEDMFATALTAPGASRALAGGRLSSAKELAEAGADAEPGDTGDPGAAGVRWPSVDPGARPRPAPPEPEAEPTDEPTEEPTEPTEAPAGHEPSPALRRARRELDRTESAVADAENRQAAAHQAYEEAAAEETAAHRAVADRRAELVAAERAERDARERARAARREREDTDRVLRDARRRLEVARERLAALDA